MDTTQRIRLIIDFVGGGIDKFRNAIGGASKDVQQFTDRQRAQAEAGNIVNETLDEENRRLRSLRNLRNQDTRTIDRQIEANNRLKRSIDNTTRSTDRQRGAIGRFNQELRDWNRSGAQVERRLARLGRAILGLAIASVLIFMQSLVSALVAVGGQAVAAAGSLAYMARTVGGILVPAIAQAIPMVGLLAATLARLKIIQDAVNQATLVQKASSRENADAQRQQADSARQVADAQRNIQEAQENLTEARREARRELQDLMLAERQSARDLIESRQALSDAIREGDVGDVIGAQLDVRGARLESARAREDAARARAGGVSGMPQVVDATRALDDATRSLAEAHQQAAESAAEQSAAEGNLAFFLQQLTPAERRLYERLLAFRKRLQDAFTPITDHLINTMTFALGRVEKLIFDPKIFRGLDLLAKKMAESGRILIRLFTNRESRNFFVETMAQARKNLEPLTKIAQNLFVAFRNISRGAAPTLNRLLGSIAGKTKDFAQGTKDIGRLNRIFAEGERHLRAWGRTLENFAGLMGDLFGAGAADSWLMTLDNFNSKLTEGRENLKKNPEAARKFFEETSEAVGYLLDIVIALGDALIEAFDPEAVRALRDILRDGLIPGLQLGIETVGKLAIAWEDMNDLLGGIPNHLLKFAVAIIVVKNTVGLLSTLIKGAASPFIFLADWFGQWRGWWTNEAKGIDKFKETLRRGKRVADSFVDGMVNGLKSVGRWFGRGIKATGEFISSAASAAGEWIGSFTSRIRRSRVGQFVSRQLLRARLWTRTAFEAADTFVTGLIAGLNTKFPKLIPFFRKWGGKFGIALAIGLVTLGLADEGFRNQVKNAVQDLVGIFADGWEFIINGLIAGLNSVRDIINKIPGVEIPEIRKLDWRQRQAEERAQRLGRQQAPPGGTVLPLQRQAQFRQSQIEHLQSIVSGETPATARARRDAERQLDKLKNTTGDYAAETQKAAKAQKGFDKQLENTTENQKKVRSQTQRTSVEIENQRGGAKKLARQLGNLIGTLFGTGEQSRNLGQVFKGVTNAVLSAFGAKKLQFSIPNIGKSLRQAHVPGLSGLGGVLEGLGGQSGGYMGMPWERGPDDRLIAVAGGEAVLTGHHQIPVNMALAYARQAGLVPYSNLQDMFAKDKRRHMTAPGYQKGGRVPRRFPDADGALSGLDALAWILRKRYGLKVISGLRPGAITTSGNPSDHGWGGAIDVSNGLATPQMDAAARWLASIGGFDFHPGVMSGGPIKQMLYRTMVGGNHFNHIHIALNEAIARNAGAVMRIFGRGAAAAMFDQIPRLMIRGPDGALKNILQLQSDKLRKGANELLAKQSGVAKGSVDEKGVRIKARYNKQELMQLWTMAGGPRNLANTAAAIALAESSGIRKAHNPSGATGLWQILGAVVPGNLYDPFVNARNAVKKWRDAGGFNPWVVYTTGAYRRFLQRGGMIPQFDNGGIVPGPLGMPTLGLLHGGETVVPTHQTGGTVGRQLTEDQRSAARLVRQAKRSKKYDDLLAKLDELTREGGVLDRIVAGIEALTETLRVGIAKLSFKIRRGIVSRIASFLNIANMELDAMNEVYDELEREGQTIRRAIRLTKAKLRKTKKKDRRQQLRNVLNTLNQRQDEVEAALADQIQSIYDAQRAVYDAAIAEFEQRLQANDLIQQILTLQGELSGVIDQAALQANLEARGGLLQEQYNFIASQLQQAQAVGDIELARELEIALLEAQLAILQNTQALQELNGTLGKEIGFSTTAWQLFRQAILNTMGGLLPQYQAQIPSLQGGGRVTSSGLVMLHAGEVVRDTNAGAVEQHYHFTEPMEVADPTVIGSKIAWEWKKNKI